MPDVVCTTASVTPGQGWSRTGGASDVGALTDASDASYFGAAGSALGSLLVQVNPPASYPNGARPSEVRFPAARTRIDHTRAGSGGVSYRCRGATGIVQTIAAGASNSTIDGTPSPFSVPSVEAEYAVPWTGPVPVEAVIVGSPSSVRVIELPSVTVRLDERPTTASPSPTGTVASLALSPSVTYADDYREQAAFRFVLFAGTVGSGTTVESLPAGTPVRDTGEVAGAANTVTWDDLAAGTYTIYARVRQAFVTADHWSLWRRWTVTYTPAVPPSPPTVSYTWPTSDPRAVVVVTAPGTGNGPATAFDLERSIDSGTTWERVLTDEPLSAAPSRQATVTDRRAPTVGTRYRARGVYYAGGDKAASTWTSATAFLSVGDRHLIGVGTPSVDGLSASFVAGPYNRTGDPSLERTMPAAVHRPLVGGLPYVTTGQPGGLDGTLVVPCLSQLDYLRWVRLWQDASRWHVRLIDRHRGARWVVFVGSAPERELTPGELPVVLELPYVEVEGPPVALTVTRP